jgi:hypothetical protein
VYCIAGATSAALTRGGVVCRATGSKIVRLEGALENCMLLLDCACSKRKQISDAQIYTDSLQ